MVNYKIAAEGMPLMEGEADCVIGIAITNEGEGLGAQVFLNGEVNIEDMAFSLACLTRELANAVGEDKLPAFQLCVLTALAETFEGHEAEDAAED